MVNFSICIAKVKDYWSEDPLLKTSFPKYRSRDRFLQILSRLHLADNESPEASKDKLHKVRSYYDYLQNKWQEYYTIGPNIIIDEGVIPYTGCLAFLQYIKNKPHKWGIKVYLLCDSKTGYCMKSIIYTGKKDTSTKQTPTEVVEHLMSGYENRGKTLYIDNYYTSYYLLNKMRDANIACTGTLRANRIGDTSLLKAMGKEETLFYLDQEKKNVLCLWQDRKIVKMLSNTGSTSIITKQITKGDQIKIRSMPKLIEDYNAKARGVDLSNQLCLHYRHPHSTRKWWRVIFEYLLEVCISNAFIIYRKWRPNYKHKAFLMEIIKELLKEPKSCKKKIHFPQWIDPSQKSKKQLRCKAKDCTTQWFCQDCSKNGWICSLCIPNCWKKYHSESA